LAIVRENMSKNFVISILGQKIVVQSKGFDRQFVIVSYG
jgi:hypothetical protein